jgi:hypothetical protein
LYDYNEEIEINPDGINVKGYFHGDIVNNTLTSGVSSLLELYSPEDIYKKIRDVASGPALFDILKSEKVFYPNDENEKLSFMEVKNILEPELLKLGFTNWKVIIKPITAKMMVSSLKNELIINENASFSRLEIERLKVHEIHTHIQRFENGKLQKYKIFQYGFSNYLETEEGLALYNEEINGVLSQDDMRKYALRVIACQWAVSKGFYELFNLLNNYVSIDDSWNLTLRVKRGLEDTSQVGGFLKDSLYLSGYMKVKNLKQSAIDNLWIGKVGIKELEIINHF